MTFSNNPTSNINPNPSFTPLEILENGASGPDIKSDIFSVIMILFSVFKLKNSNYGSPLYLETDDPNVAKQKFRELENSFTKQKFVDVFPDELKDLASRSISSTPGMRPAINEFKLNPWFNDNLLRGLYNLTEFYKLELPKQKIYLKAFAKIVPKYSDRIVKERILPFLTDQLLNPNGMYEVVCILLYILQTKKIANDTERK